MNCSLDDLYASTEMLVNEPDRLTRILEWRERIPPRVPAACRDAVLAKAPPETFDRWLSWLDGPAGEALSESGSPETADWLAFWLRTLVVAAGALARGADALLVADELRSGDAGAWPWLPDAFWRSLTAYLSAPPRPGSSRRGGSRQVRFRFPLILSEAAIVDGEETDQVLAEFVLEACPTTGGQVFPHPEQLTIRCLDAEFGAAFRRAAAAVRSLGAAGSGLSPDVSVRIEPVRPEHEVFLREFVLRGGSGAGALALGLYLLRHGPARTLSVEGVAASFALGAGGAAEEGRWQCLPVGDLERKVRCCAHERLRELIVSDQDAGPALTVFARRSGVALAAERDFADAVRRLNEPTSPTRPPGTHPARSWGLLAGGLGLALLARAVLTPHRRFLLTRSLHQAGGPEEVYDLVADFSIYENPSGAWAYGSMDPGPMPVPATFRPFQIHRQQSNGLVCWHDPPWTDPTVLKNMSGGRIRPPGLAWQFNQVSLHPGPRGEYAAVCWTASEAGGYRIDGEFSGLDTNGPTATDAHLFLNSVSLTSRGVSPSRPLLLSKQVQVVPGDRLYFVVGWGGEQRYECQTTGLDVLITRR